ncbi:heterokaryon incompatibility protein [Rutstroemia sp. NJR-2017a WRK4]|nr:heterokaryon incompatibility protein [Rutstroemia sp. NJR-2017a WRK4]
MTDSQSVENPVAELMELRTPIGFAFSIIADSGSDQAFQRISTWLADCLAHHECNPMPEVYMPNRLLDLESRIADGRAVLVNFTNPVAQPAAPYACLGYCWGTDLDNNVKTLKANFKHHQDVLVCQRLGIRYLWVDALCIIQDDEEDWKNESMRMCDIYSRSHITIAAHRAESCKQGFLGKQEFAQQTFHLEFSTNFGELVKGANPKTMIIRRHLPRDSNSSKEDRTPLQRRGWTLQGTIMPSRIVHFTKNELAWECNSRHFCECGHVQGLCNQVTVWPMDKTAIILDYGYLLESKDSTLAGYSWMKLVEIYSQRKLTLLSDKLMAIFGVAQSIRAGIPGNMDSRYVGGIFTMALPRQLLWRVGDTKEPYPSTRPFPGRLPTWPWASVNSPIGFVAMFADSEEVYVETEVYQANSVRLGDELLLKGMALPVKVMTVECGLGHPGPSRCGLRPLTGYGKIEFERMCRRTMVRTSEGHKIEVICDTERDVELLACQDGWDCWQIDESNTHKCDRCQTGTWDPDGNYYTVKVAGYCFRLIGWKGYILLLQRSEIVPGVWERLGLAEMKLSFPATRSPSPSWWRWFRDVETKEFKII